MNALVIPWPHRPTYLIGYALMLLTTISVFLRFGFSQAVFYASGLNFFIGLTLIGLGNTFARKQNWSTKNDVSFNIIFVGIMAATFDLFLPGLSYFSSLLLIIFLLISLGLGALTGRIYIKIKG